MYIRFPESSSLYDYISGQIHVQGRFWSLKMRVIGQNMCLEDGVTHNIETRTRTVNSYPLASLLLWTAEASDFHSCRGDIAGQLTGAQV